MTRMIRGRSLRLSACAALWCVVAVGSPAEAQLLEPGDMVVGGSFVVDGFGSRAGRIWRVRNGTATIMIDGGMGVPFPSVEEMIIDSESRIIFSAFGCGGNSNASGLWRYDPATGVVEQFACLPYIANATNIPDGLPPDASSFYWLRGLHLSRALRITIDDDVNSGLPQVAYSDTYVFSINTAINGQTRPRAFQYVPADGRFEDSVSLDLLSHAIVRMVEHDGWTYYANGHQIGRAQVPVTMDVRLDGDLGTLQARLTLSGRNELIHDGEILDHLETPNVLNRCGDLVDDNAPEGPGYHVLSGINNIGFVEGGLFVTSNSGAAARPWLFSLAPRAPFLNPIVCFYFNASQYSSPFAFFDGSEIVHDSALGDGARVLGTQADRLVSITPDGGVTTIAQGMTGARSVALYPPTGSTQSARNLTLRMDEPGVTFLLTNSEGDQLGHDPNGAEINDFGDRARILALGPGGTPPIIYTLTDPAEGPWRLQARAAAATPDAYTIRGYLADTSEGGTMASAPADADAPDEVDDFIVTITDPLGLTIEPHCPSDLDFNGDTDVFDLLAYLDLWFEADSAAELDGTAGIDVFDLLIYLDSWFTPC